MAIVNAVTAAAAALAAWSFLQYINQEADTN